MITIKTTINFRGKLKLYYRASLEHIIHGF
jgi:hypothetical protein